MGKTPQPILAIHKRVYCVLAPYHEDGGPILPTTRVRYGALYSLNAIANPMDITQWSVASQLPIASLIYKRELFQFEGKIVPPAVVESADQTPGYHVSVEVPENPLAIRDAENVIKYNFRMAADTEVEI
jgi:hypothetical protein